MMRRNVRNYIHAERGDMPAERQVTWRGCARDWITNGQFGQHIVPCSQLGWRMEKKMKSEKPREESYVK